MIEIIKKLALLTANLDDEYKLYPKYTEAPVFKKYIIPGINFFSLITIIVVVGVVAVSGIQYAASQDNPQMAADAKKRIASAIIALAMYAMLYGLLEWLIPGDLFSV